MNISALEEAGKHLGLVAGILGSLAFIWKFVYTPIKKWRERKKAFRDTIAKVCTTCDDLNKRFNTIEFMIGSLRQQRENDHKADAKIRSTLYRGQVAMISAVRELASHQGLKINGPVELYYEENKEALKAGLGIEDELNKGGS
jgi:hypothetical protein